MTRLSRHAPANYHAALFRRPGRLGHRRERRLAGRPGQEVVDHELVHLRRGYRPRPSRDAGTARRCPSRSAPAAPRARADRRRGRPTWMVLSCSALISAASSTTEPRAMLMRMPSGPSASSTSALMRFLVSGPPGVMTSRMSTSRAMSSSFGIVAVAHARRRPAAVIDHRHLEAVEPARDRLADARPCRPCRRCGRAASPCVSG